MRGRRDESTNRCDEVELEEAADPVDAGDDGNWLLGKTENALSELLSLAFDVPGGHGGEGGDWARVRRGRSRL